MTRVLVGAVQLPSQAAMQADVAAQQKWRRQIMPESCSRAGVYSMYQQQYFKQLVQDMQAKVCAAGCHVRYAITLWQGVLNCGQ